MANAECTPRLELGKHPYGYTSFHYDLTPFLKKGDNILAVRVDNSVQPNSRWYSLNSDKQSE